MNTSNPSTNPYDAYYYAHNCGDTPYKRDEKWLKFFEGIALQIANQIQPRTVLDAGCALGFLVEALRKLGIEAYGIDISEYAIQNTHPDIRPYCQVGSISKPFPMKYDLIISIEVLEHMPKIEADQALKNFCQHSNDIVFSSTPFDYKEATHINVQPPEYWGEAFAMQKFFRDVDFDAAFITPWAARFHRDERPLQRIVRDYERKYWYLWKEYTDLRQLAVENRDELSTTEQKLIDAQIQLAQYQAQIGPLPTPDMQLQKLGETFHQQLIEKNQQIEAARLELHHANNRMAEKERQLNEYQNHTRELEHIIAESKHFGKTQRISTNSEELSWLERLRKRLSR